MKQLFYTFLWLAVLALAKSITDENPVDLLVEYASAFSGDLKDVPPPMLREALRNALPKMQERLVDYSVNLFASGRGAEGVKPNPMLIGFSMGMKRWSEYLSKFIPLLSKVAIAEQSNDSSCLFDDDVCYADISDSHPCCDVNVSCPLSLYDLLYYSYSE